MLTNIVWIVSCWKNEGGENVQVPLGLLFYKEKVLPQIRFCVNNFC